MLHKFLNSGGHTPVLDSKEPGVIVEISKERFEEIKNDPPDRLRSQFGKPEIDK